MSMTLSGDNGVTFPNNTTQASAGVVLQVVQSTYSTQVSISSGTVATGITATITPKFSTSKILVLISQQYNLTQSGGANLYGYFTLNRGASAILTGVAGEVQLNSGTQVAGRASFNLLDSPSTTSPTTYTLYYTPVSGSPQLMNSGGNTSFITLMEITQ